MSKIIERHNEMCSGCTYCEPTHPMDLVQMRTLPNGGEIWFTGKFEDLEFCDKPIDLFPSRKLTLKEKSWKDLDGVEWTQRCVDTDWVKDRPRDVTWAIKGLT